jgi:hypothetical protein
MNGIVDTVATADYVVHASAIVDPGYGQGLVTLSGTPAAITIIVPSRSTTTT